MDRLLKLVRGFPGHPAHPPLTDLTIGIYTFAAVLGVTGALGGLKELAGRALFVALVAGLISTVPTATTGFIDWLSLTWGTPSWRTATLHMVAMLAATTIFAVAAWLQWPGYQPATVTAGGLVLTLLGFAVLAVGGWLGGTIVFVHGVRVLGLPDEPTGRTIKPGAESEGTLAKVGMGTREETLP